MKRATVETTKTEMASEGKTECHQLSKKAMGNSPSCTPSQYCKMGPSTKLGTDTPSTATTTAIVSQTVLCHNAATTPRTIPTISPKITACIDRKSTRLNSSHANISYAVFCLKKKKNK